MSEARRLATRTSIRAFYESDSAQLLIVATGEASAGDRIEIEAVQPAGTPLEYELVAYRKPGMWPTVMVPYQRADFFTLPGDPATIRIAGRISVRHADGVDDVQLEPLPADIASATRSVAAGPSTATGYSTALSFDEAFKDALSILGSMGASHPDALLHVRVDDVGGLFGGIAGFHHLYVKLSTVGLPSGPITEVAPERALSEVIVEVAPERPYAEVIVEVAPERPSAEVIVEVAPERPYAEVIVEVAPERPYAEVIVEVAPERPYAEVIVEVAPDRPGGIVEVAPERQGPIQEVAPERPEGDVITEVAPDRPYASSEVIAEVAPDRIEGEPPEAIGEVNPERPDEGEPSAGER